MVQVVNKFNTSDLCYRWKDISFFLGGEYIFQHPLMWTRQKHANDVMIGNRLDVRFCYMWDTIKLTTGIHGC